MNLSHFRNDFTKDSLELTDLKENPFQQFEKWFQRIIDESIREPNAMSLATVNREGAPTLRTVLLKYFDEKGFVFYTNYQSRKAKDIEGNPQAALLFFWKEFEQQVKICGKAEKISQLETLKYFSSRPRDSQIGAWVSQQSQSISSKTLLKQKFLEMSRKFKDGQVPLPSFWGGFRVIPHSFEFWQGGKNRLHDRFYYSQIEGGKWKIERLMP